MQDTPAIQGLIKKYGARAVWDAGLEANGFPITWAPRSTDIIALAASLESF